MTEFIKEIKKAPITVVLVVINICVFLVLEVMGDTQDGYFMVRYGAMNPEMVLQYGQWYRLFTSMFLHFGGEHIVNNMLLLFLLGQYFEKAVGPVRFLGVYLFSGVIGSFVSMVHMLVVGTNDISAGASGAIFGLVGGLLLVILVHKGRYEHFSTKRMLFMAALSLYAGFVTTGVDNYAHIAGLISGFLITFFVYGIPHLLGRKN